MLTHDARRFEAALEGSPAADQGLGEELALAALLRDMPPGPRPDPAFVAALQERLLASPAPEAAPATAGPARRRPPRTVVVGRGVRLAAAAVVAVVAVAAVIGAGGRRSLPGEPLYAARHLVDRAEVLLARAPQDRGLRLLEVAERHVVDAETLGARPAGPATGEGLRTAVEDGGSAADEGRATLVDDFRARTDPASLVALSRFAERILPRTADLESRAPADVRRAVATLTGTVVGLRDEALTLLAACATCGAAADEARQRLVEQRTSATTTAPAVTPSAPAPTTTAVASARPGATPAPAPGTGGGGPAATGTEGASGVGGPAGDSGPSTAAEPSASPSSSSPSPSSAAPTAAVSAEATVAPPVGPSLSVTLSASVPVLVP